MANIIDHQETEDCLDDESHPIPALKVIDVNAVKKNGGSDLSIIIASPLRSDEYSLTRLLDKIEGYLVHIQSNEFKEESGVPSPENTTIIVHVHPESDAEVFNLLKRSEQWVCENNASLKVVLLNEKLQ